MTRRIAWTMTLLAGLLTASCNEPASRGSAAPGGTGGAASMPSENVEFVSVGSGNQAWNPREEGFGPQFVLFRSRAAWDKLGGYFQFGEAAPDWRERIAKVDFTRQSIAALTLGERGSTGYAIRLERIEDGPRLTFVMTSTKPEAAAGMMMTHPFRLVILNRAEVPADARFTLDGKDTEFERHVME
jgi:hypothetical protein